MRTFALFMILFFSVDLFADDMTFTTKYPEEKSGIFAGIMPKNLPDEEGYKGSETTITPLFVGGRYAYNNLIFNFVIPLIINPDESKDDIMLNTVLLDTSYLLKYENLRILNGIQFTPAINLGTNPQNEVRNNISVYSYIYSNIIRGFSGGLSLQYYQSLSDKIKYGEMYITRANSGFSTEMKFEYYFDAERLSVLSDLLLFRDLSNGVSNIYFNPGIRFLPDECNSVYVTLSIPLYDERFTDRYGSGLNLYYDRKF